MSLDQPGTSDALWKINNQLGIRPEWVLAVIYLESKFNPAATNPSGCVGLNQFCRSTFSNYVGVSPEEYKSWPASAQLSGPIFNYWRDATRSGTIDSAAKLMVAQLSQAALKRAHSPGDVVFSAPSAEYEQNQKVFDPNKKGYFTLGDIAGVLGYLSKLQVVQAAVNDAYYLHEHPEFRAPTVSGHGALWAGAFALALGAAYGAYSARKGRFAWIR